MSYLNKIAELLHEPNMEFAKSFIDHEINRRVRMNTKWVKWKEHQGAHNRGEVGFKPEEPYDIWTKILGVVARCEGNHDTFVSYDNTGATWGFMQWTMTSGRLPKLLESFKAISHYDFSKAETNQTLFDAYCMKKGEQIFEPFGFRITGGKFIENASGKELRPEKQAEKQRIVDVCMGKTLYNTFKAQQEHALTLADTFVKLGNCFGIPEAQIAFAQQEMQRGLKIVRKPLQKYESIDRVLTGTWETPAPAVFYNLCINNPAAAYSLIIKARDAVGDKHALLFERMWELLKISKFGNWSFAKPENKSPRIMRIKKALKEFYNIDVSVK